MVGQQLPQTNKKCYSVPQCPMWPFLPLFYGSKHTYRPTFTQRFACWLVCKHELKRLKRIVQYMIQDVSAVYTRSRHRLQMSAKSVHVIGHLFQKKKIVIGHLVISSKSFTLNTKDEGLCEKRLFGTWGFTEISCKTCSREFFFIFTV